MSNHILMQSAGTRLVVSPDAAARLAAAHRWLSSYRPDAEVLVIAPSREAGDDFVRAATQVAGARFGLVHLTLDRLAARLAAPILASSNRAPASSFSLAALAARAVFLLQRSGGLSYFAPVANRPGLPVAMAATIEELRMNHVDVEAIRELERGGPDLAAFIDLVEEELGNASLVDRATKFESALQAIDGGSYPAGIPLLILDVSVSSRLEAELLGVLVSRAPAAFATAPEGDTSTIVLLQRVLSSAAERIGVDQTVLLSSLKTHLFEETKPQSASADNSVVLRSWPGESRECVEIARSIQQEAAGGIPLDRIAVLLRSPAEYRPHIEEAFRRAAIPIYFARGTTRPDPSGRALLALLGCAAEKLSARRFAEYVSLGQVPDRGEAVTDQDRNWSPPESELLPYGVEPSSNSDLVEQDVLVPDPDIVVSVEGTLHAPWRWEQMLVDAAVIGGRDRWVRRLNALEQELLLHKKEIAEEDETRAAMIDRQLLDLKHLGDFALPIIARLAALPERATWGQWIAHLRDIAIETLRDPEAVLATLAELEPASPVGPVDLDEVQLVLAPRLRDLRTPAPRVRYGAVFIGTAESARGLAFDVVFVPGLAEKLFPRKVVEDPILLDDQRRALGIAELTTQQLRVTREQLALRLAVGAASKQVYLSYPRVDIEQVRPRVPSFYSLETMRAARGRLPGFDELGKEAESQSHGRLGWPAPDSPKDAVDEAEYDLALLAPLLRSDADNAGTATYLLNSNGHLARALRSRARRWLRRWTVADGFVDPDELGQKAIAGHHLSNRSFSPTALQNFAVCPYRFFLQAVHRLQPREEALPLEVIDPLTRGAFFHDAQFKILTRLRDSNLLPVTKSTLVEAIAIVSEIVDAVAAEYKERLAPAMPRVWEDGITAIRAELYEWLRRAAENQAGWMPYRFELAFGLADRDRPNADPASVPHSVAIVGKLQLRGSIDLVERHESGILRAIDHKTGKARAKPGVVIGGGQVLQPVLYALVCEKLLNEPVESGMLYYCTSDGGYEKRTVGLDPESRASAAALVEIIGNALETGFLPSAPDKGSCKWCDYRPVCGPYEESRTSRKPQDRLSELIRLRSLT